MQRNTIVPMLMLVAMFGVFIHYDLTSSTQYSVIDSIWPSIILILIIFIVVIIRSRGESVLGFFSTIIFAPLYWLLSLLFRNYFTMTHKQMGGSREGITDFNSKPDLDLKENLHNRITKMLDENDKYDEFTVTTILKELEKIK